MIKSEYLELFKEVDQSMNELCTLKDNYILVEKIEFEMKTKSGIVLAGSKGNFAHDVLNDLPEWYVVLKVGEGYDSEESKEKSQDLLEVKVGNVCLIPRLSVRPFYYFGNIKGYAPSSIGMSTSSSSSFIFKDVAAFNKYFFEVLK
jgi:co-chaperonin GroES (HSP10)